MIEEGIAMREMTVSNTEESAFTNLTSMIDDACHVIANAKKEVIIQGVAASREVALFETKYYFRYTAQFSTGLIVIYEPTAASALRVLYESDDALAECRLVFS